MKTNIFLRFWGFLIFYLLGYYIHIKLTILVWLQSLWVCATFSDFLKIYLTDHNLDLKLC